MNKEGGHLTVLMAKQEISQRREAQIIAELSIKSP